MRSILTALACLALAASSCCGQERPRPDPSTTPSWIDQEDDSPPKPPTPPLTGDAALAAIRASRFAPNLPALEKAMLPVVRVDARPAPPGTLAIGDSHFAGEPDVPEGFRWPMLGPVPLAFLAQIRLQDLPPQGTVPSLPASGWLLFFYEVDKGGWGFAPSDRDAFRVLYVDVPVPSLRRTPAPAELPEASRGFKPCALQFSSGVSLPDPSDTAFAPLGIDLDKEGALEAYMALLERIEGTGSSDGYHHLLGYPQIIQNDMRLEAQLASSGINCGGPEGYADPRAKALEAGAADWTLLMQIDSDEPPGWGWGDTGTLYFWIRKQDLAARRFDAAWMILQCY